MMDIMSLTGKERKPSFTFFGGVEIVMARVNEVAKKVKQTGTACHPLIK
jgi:hypothetical protein